MYVDVPTFAVCFCETSSLYGTKPMYQVQVDTGKLENIPYESGKGTTTLKARAAHSAHLPGRPDFFRSLDAMKFFLQAPGLFP